jgi:aminoglycoside 2''-phosphotransferase
MHIRRSYRYLRRKKGYRFVQGHDVDVYSSDGSHFLYFPKSPALVTAMEREVAVLRALPRLPLLRWTPSDCSRDTRAVGRFFIGGLPAPGAPMMPEALDQLRETPRWRQFASLLGHLLTQVHATPLERIPVQLPPPALCDAWERVYSKARARFFGLLSPQQRSRLTDRFESALADLRLWQWKPTLIHGDFTPHNILCVRHKQGDASLSAIRGWRQVGLGDPAADLATLLGPDGYGEEFLTAFGEAYPGLNEQLPRARWYASVRPVRDALAVPLGEEVQAIQRLIARAGL